MYGATKFKGMAPAVCGELLKLPSQQEGTQALFETGL